jgi:hypothetical protein
MRSTSLGVMLLLVAVTNVNAQDHTSHKAEPNTNVELFPHRVASGTAWTPDTTPMFGSERNWLGWAVMLHGRVFGQALGESPEKHRTGGADGFQLSSVNWGMVMARRAVAGGRFGFRTMLSAEPWTVSDCGFLNLLATGEICEGDTIHDRQHPHDLVMELAIDFDRALAGSLRWQMYAGLAGEPALGPPAFPHRLSAVVNPIAPISHHWLDSSHITFGLVTGAVYSERWKGEVSVFNGREPDADRADLDLAPLDSVSGRLSFMPNDRTVVQVSSGHLNEAEAEFGSQPRSDLYRSTTSFTYHRPYRQSGMWATTIAYGVNSGREVLPDGPVDARTHALMAESTVMLDERHWVFGRAEIVGKPAHDLHAHEYGAEVFTVGKVQTGYTRNFTPRRGLVPSVGGTIALSLVPPELAPRYSGRRSWSAGLFFAVGPRKH